MHIVLTAAAALLPFVCAACFHLFYCFHGKHGYADITKIMLMPLLLLAYLAAVFAAGAMPSVLIVTALIASWCGDLFLIRTDKKSFVLGVLSFAAAHLLYIVFAVIKLLALEYGVQLLTVCVLTAVYAVLITILMLRLFRYLKAMTKPVLGYTLIIAGMSLCFVLYAIQQPSPASVCAAAGSLFFVFSDSLLAHAEFVGVFPKSRFAVMATYLLAQLFIAVSAFLSVY